MPLPREPQRRTEDQRRKHLDAHEVILERALLARAAGADCQTDNQTDPAVAAAYEVVRDEFRALADELHYW